MCVLTCNSTHPFPRHKLLTHCLRFLIVLRGQELGGLVELLLRDPVPRLMAGMGRGRLGGREEPTAGVAEPSLSLWEGA